MIKLSIIIVNFNAGELLTESVRSVVTSSIPVEVFVSDNGNSAVVFFGSLDIRHWVS